MDREKERGTSGIKRERWIKRERQKKWERQKGKEKGNEGEI